MLEMLLKKFEPETDLLDRRILYEVARMRLNEEEFKDEDSSDSSQDPPDDDSQDSNSPKITDVLPFIPMLNSSGNGGSV